jgi:nucleoside-diphosphate-sugar epimerase
VSDAAVLVTGCSGFIGGAVARRLAAEGRPVIGMDRVSPGEDAPFPAVQADLGDVHRLYATLIEHRVDRLVRAGALSGPMLARDSPHLMFEINVCGTMNVLEAARVSGVRRVVFLSSIMAYGEHPVEVPVTEETPLRACDPYGSSKICGEAIVRAYAAGHGVDGVALRLAGVYGPGRTTDCLIGLMLENARAGRRTALPYGAGWFRQYVSVDDVVEAIVRALDRERLPQPAYNVSGGSHLVLEKVAAVIASVVPGVEVDLGPAPHPMDYRLGPFDLGAAERDLGYRPRVDLRNGVAAYAEWLKASAGRGH